MTSNPDDEPRWEVMPNFQDRTGIQSYRVPAADSPDPTVVEGHGQPPYVHVAPVMMGIPLSGFVFSVLGHTIVAGGIALALLTSVIVVGRLLTARRRAWKVPRLVATAEGLSVTDVTGRTSEVAWTEFLSPSLSMAKRGRDTVQVLEWTNASGERVSVNLGDTMDIVQARRAILAHTPLSLDWS